MSALLIAGALLAGVFLWKALPRDPVGRVQRERMRHVGFQGQLTEHLYWDATLTPPRPERLGPPPAGSPGRIADRALWAVVLAHAQAHRMKPEEALKALRKQAKGVAAAYFLAGKMRRAVRAHWRTKYRGPLQLYLPWFYLVASIRHGRRHLYLDTLSSILKELRNP